MTLTYRPVPATEGREAIENPPVRRRNKRVRYALTVLVFLLPSALPLAFFTIYPMFGALWASFHKWNLLAPMQWVGIDNYISLAQDPMTQRAFFNTFYYLAGYLPLVFVGGLALALALNERIKGRNILRGVYFLPVVTSWIVVALVWRWLLNPSVGIVNAMLGVFGIDGPGWWTDPAWAMPSIIIASAWKDLGFVMIILLAGLQAIPQEMYEAAKVDGAGAWRRLFNVTLPLLSPSTFFVVVISLINGFQVFDQVYAMTGGGPAGASTVVVQQIFDLTFRYGAAGEASALSWMLFVLVLGVTVVQIIGQRKWVTYA
ncbi:multiple sugar transport system permease protein [Microbacterium halimionae]|uniref:Multiple sugar transport system permease protein n=1 Tax=Microbacterium halimionae TaxID=1526413 RepID=A0A7W3JMX1_9MICO|nr:sugar ABC transporter permease [Microbacterium halimionae]MBA8815815.1 multiple sugar transport system permease protein [Microbacterium halimionae]NII95861.1 multiple sugar transport system permease protein [Microbacterium halimionae]